VELLQAQQDRDAAQAASIVATQARQVAEAARVAAEAATQQAIAAANQPAPTAVSFALMPALDSSAIIDYKSGEGIKIYGKATALLDIAFGGESGALRLFPSKVQQRANQFGWTAILQINQGGQNFNLITHYGQVTLALIRAQATAIKAASNRGTHNSSQMYTYLITSITDGMLGKVISKKDDYTSATAFQDGPSLLKVIITISHVNTRAQSRFIPACLSWLLITILEPEYNCNIEKINEYTVVLEEGLAARGELSQDTMMNVQSAYAVCKDAAFVAHKGHTANGSKEQICCLKSTWLWRSQSTRHSR
jgi:hypothetical protein